MAILSLSPLAGFGQTSGTGLIVGSVTNESTQKVLERASVTVAGTNLSALTAADGSFRLVGVPAGAQTVRIGYAGLDDKVATVSVAPGVTATLDVALKGDVLQLSAFHVAAEREGNAYANIVTREYKNHRTVFDAEARYTLSPRYTLSLAGRNVTEAEEGQHFFDGRSTRLGTGGGTALTLTLAARF